MINGDWGLGIGDGDCGLGFVPNLQSPLPNPTLKIYLKNIYLKSII